MNPVQGTVVGNRFRLVRELGRGAMGAVWLADHLTLEVPCAVKLIVDPSGANSAAQARFHLEAKAVARVQSPNVVRILDHDVCEDVAYIAMELLQGEELRTRLLRAGRLGPEETCRIVSQAARGLAKAHAAGIVHRDLKPENVFIALEDDVETAKLLDFGIALLTASPMPDASPQAGGICGTPEYMSPEQACGGLAIDHRSDLWSLGVIAFECLTGRRPFEGNTLIDLLAEVIAREIPVPSELDSGLPVALDAWWARAAARDPDKRFQSARELADALAVALGIDARTALRSEPPPSGETRAVFDRAERAATLAGPTLVMARNEVTPAKAWRPKPGRKMLLARAAAMTLAIVAGTMLNGRADQAVRQVSVSGTGVDAMDSSATRLVPAACPEVLSAPAEPGAAEPGVTPPARPAAGHSSRAAPRARPIPRKQPVDDVDFGI